MARTITKTKAVQLANEFLGTQELPREYTLKFDSTREVEGKIQVKYTKIFKEPVKQSPPYRLVIVDAGGGVQWGNP